MRRSGRVLTNFEVAGDDRLALFLVDDIALGSGGKSGAEQGESDEGGLHGESRHGKMGRRAKDGVGSTRATATRRWRDKIWTGDGRGVILLSDAEALIYDPCAHSGKLVSPTKIQNDAAGKK